MALPMPFDAPGDERDLAVQRDLHRRANVARGARRRRRSRPASSASPASGAARSAATCDPHRADAAAVELLGGEPPAVELDRLADLGDVLERAEQEAADGVPLLVGQVAGRAAR